MRQNIDTENGDGTSAITIFELDGSSTTTDYGGPNGTGPITAVDQENANGSSVLTTVNPDGSSVASTYAGPDSTGTVKEIDDENTDGTSTITIFNPGGSSTTTSYSGPDGSGNVIYIMDEDTEGNIDLDVSNDQNVNIPNQLGTIQKIFLSYGSTLNLGDNQFQGILDGSGIATLIMQPASWGMSSMSDYQLFTTIVYDGNGARAGTAYFTVDGIGGL